MARAWQVLESLLESDEDAIWDRAWKVLSSKFSADEAQKIWDQIQHFDADEVEEWMRELEGTKDSGGYLPDEAIKHPPGGNAEVPIPPGGEAGVRSMVASLKKAGAELKSGLDRMIDIWETNLSSSPHLKDRIELYSVYVAHWPEATARFAKGRPTREDLNMFAAVAEDNNTHRAGALLRRVLPFVTSLLAGRGGPATTAKQDYAEKERHVLDYVRSHGKISKGELARKIAAVYGRAPDSRGSTNIGVYGTIGYWLDKGKVVRNQDGTISAGDERTRAERPKQLVADLLDAIGQTMDNPTDQSYRHTNFKYARNAVGKAGMRQAIRSWPRFNELIQFMRRQESLPAYWSGNFTPKQLKAGQVQSKNYPTLKTWLQDLGITDENGNPRS